MGKDWRHFFLEVIGLQLEKVDQSILRPVSFPPVLPWDGSKNQLNQIQGFLMIKIIRTDAQDRMHVIRTIVVAMMIALL
jgi:hypothetical protein